MKLLALETSTSACSVAILDSSRTQLEQTKMLHEHAPMQQARLVLPMIQTLMSSVLLKVNDLDAIAYGCGPGSFTGIRLASSVAQAMGYAASVPIIAVSSLAAMAKSASLAHENKDCLDFYICVDARMGKVYLAHYRRNELGDMRLIGQELVIKPSDILDDDLPKKWEKWCAIGDGWHRDGNLRLRLQKGSNAESLIVNTTPNALAVIELARLKFEQGLFLEPKDALPVYLQ